MANLNEKSFVTKLRGTDTSKFRSQYRYHANIDLQLDCESTDDSYISQEYVNQNNLRTELVPEPSRMKYKGRGMAIAQMAQSVTDLNLKMKNFNPEYSNMNIEQHFKNLKDENTKKIEEENNKLWEKMLCSKKSS